MKRCVLLLLTVIMIFNLTACSGSGTAGETTDGKENRSIDENSPEGVNIDKTTGGEENQFDEESQSVDDNLPEGVVGGMTGGEEDQSVDENSPEGVTFDEPLSGESRSDEPVKSVIVYTGYSEMFFNNTNGYMGPGLLRITYNSQNNRLEEYQLAFYDKNLDEADENVYFELTDDEGTYSNCVTNVRREGKYILADGVEGFINLYGLEIASSYDRLLDECVNDEYMKEYDKNIYFNWDFYKGIYFYDDVHELDLSILEKDFSWNEGKDLSELQNLLTYNEYIFTASDGSEQTLEVRIVDDMMSGLMLFSNYLSPIGTDDYRIDGNTLYVVSDCCCYEDSYYAYLAQLDFNGDKLTATFHLYDENEKITLDNYTDKTELYTLTFDCTAH